MKQLEQIEEGFSTSIGSIHLESFLHDGLYEKGPQVKRFGMLRIDENDDMAFYRTDNGIAIDLKKLNRHLIFGTANFGDPIGTPVWYCITRAVAAELDGEFMPDTFIPSSAREKEAAEYIEVFLAHLKKHYEV